MNREAIMNCGPAAVLIRHQYHTTQESGLLCAADPPSKEGTGVEIDVASGSGLLRSAVRREGARNDCFV
jgi:hypothetical protein